MSHHERIQSLEACEQVGRFIVATAKRPAANDQRDIDSNRIQEILDLADALEQRSAALRAIAERFLTSTLRFW